MSFINLGVINNIGGIFFLLRATLAIIHLNDIHWLELLLLLLLKLDIRCHQLLLLCLWLTSLVGLPVNIIISLRSVLLLLVGSVWRDHYRINLLSMSETHSLGLVITDIVLASTILLYLFKVTQIVLLLKLLNLLLILRCPHSISMSVCLVHDVHLGLKLKIEFLKTFNENYYYLPVFLEEGIVIITSIVFSVQLHVVQTIGVFARIGKEFVNHCSSNFFTKLVLLFVEELHLLLFTYFLQLGPKNG